MTSHSITIQNLTFGYYSQPDKTDSKDGTRNIFEDFTLSFEAGKPTALMAPSGSGKTTLLYLIAGLQKPQKGTIGYPYDTPRFSMVFQEDRLLEQETILTNLTLVNPSWDTAMVLEVLSRAGLEHCILSNNKGKTCKTKSIHQLSGGEKRRIAILRALLAEYDILLMDEPFTGLDEATKTQMIAFINEMTSGKTVICVTHNRADAAALNCETIIDLGGQHGTMHVIF